MARINACSGCKFYKAETDSCGELLTLRNAMKGTRGGLVDPEAVDISLVEREKMNKVSYYKKKIRLCGCEIREKAKYAFETCPIGRWGKYRLSDEETEILEEFIMSLPKHGKYSSTQVDEIIKWFERTSGRPMKRCDECVRAVVKELQIQIGRKQDTQI